MPKIARWRKADIVVPKEGATVEGYVRFSTANQRDNLSVDVQQKIIQQYCDDRSWVIVSWCIDEADSGGKDEIEKRRLWAAHIAKIGTIVEVSVCLEPKRWSRNLETKLKSLRMITEQGGYWVCADGSEDLQKLSNDLGRKITSAISAINSTDELDYMSKRIHQSKVERAKVLGLHNGVTVYGYDYAPIEPPPPGYNKMIYKTTVRNPLVPDETYIESAGMTRFQIVQHMGYLRSEGKSHGEIAEWAYSVGLRTRKGLKFTDDAIRIIFNSPIPRGKVHNPEAIGTPYERLQVALVGRHVAAWDEELCKKIDRVNQENHLIYQHTIGSTTRSRREREGMYHAGFPFCYSGLLICAACKTTMIHNAPDRYKDKSKRYGFPCPDKNHAGIREVYLDVCMAHILNTVMPESWQTEIAEAVKQLAQINDTHVEQDEIVTEHLARLEAERKRLLKLYIGGEITEEEKGELLEPIVREMKELKRTPKKIPTFDTQTLLDQFQEWTNLSTLWKSSPPEQRGQLLTSLIHPHGIEVDLGNRQIVAIKPLSPFDMLCGIRYSSLVDGWYSIPYIPVEQFTAECKEMAVIRGVNIFTRKDGSLRRTSRVMTKELENQVVAYLEEKRAINWIARTCDLERSTIYKIAKRRNIIVDRGI